MTEKGLIKLHVYELQIGMYVSRLEIPWEQSPFLMQGFDLKTQADIKAVQDVCDYVFIDPSYQKQTHGDALTRNSGTEKQLNFSQAFAVSQHTYQQTSHLVKDLMDDVRFGNTLNTEAAKAAVADCVDRIIENSDAMALLTQLKNKDEYTQQHSLNVCILAIMLGRYQKKSIADLNNLGICALLHDMGKMKVPLEILNKPGKLTDQEMRLMEAHTTWGRDVIMSARGVFSGAVDVAYGHHEKLNGSGYPRGIKAQGISEYTRLVAIVDAYDAITSDRVYQKGRLHLEAINILTRSRETHFDAGMVIQFIDCIGIYPVGNLVEMSNGEVAVVIEKNTKSKTRPKVLLLLDAEKKPLQHQIVDLAAEAKDTSGETYRIHKVLHSDAYGIDLKKLHEQGQFNRVFGIR